MLEPLVARTKRIMQAGSGSNGNLICHLLECKGTSKLGLLLSEDEVLSRWTADQKELVLGAHRLQLLSTQDTAKGKGRRITE